MFGDNRSVVDSSSQHFARLHKQHHALSFHCMRHAIAAGIVHYVFTPGKNNPSDILRKHLSYNNVKPLLKGLLFWPGDTAELIKMQ